MGSRWQKVGGVERPPITNPIANPAPIEHGLVMDEWSAMTMQSRLRCLARNLRDAAGCALAFDLGERLGAWHFNEMDKSPAPWDSNRAGQAAPRWER